MTNKFLGNRKMIGRKLPKEVKMCEVLRGVFYWTVCKASPYRMPPATAC